MAKMTLEEVMPLAEADAKYLMEVEDRDLDRMLEASEKAAMRSEATRASGSQAVDDSAAPTMEKMALEEARALAKADAERWLQMEHEDQDMMLEAANGTLHLRGWDYKGSPDTTGSTTT